MEINFDNRTIPIYKELFYQTKNIQEISESVVPDTDEDIGKLAVVQSTVLLKSKDITSRGVLVTGEACASLMYITESQDKVSYMKLKKAFSIEYDIADIIPDAVAQVKLSILSTEARLINPRKVSICFEIAGELSCYIAEDMSVEYGVPANACRGLHAKYENTEINVVSAVCEKTFSLNEQFNFPGGKPKPSKLIYANAELLVNDTQLIGTKAIVKGNAEISLCYLSDEVNYPVKTEFSTAFSQIIDIGEDAMDSCNVIPAVTGLYYNIADSISGDKLMDVELHAVLQLCCRSNRQLVYISDVYSNLMPAVCNIEKNSINIVSDFRKLKMSADERLSIDDCADMLSLFVSLAHMAQEADGIKATLSIELVYRNNSGQLSSARRSITIQTECPAPSFRINSARLADVYLRPDGQYLDCHLAVELGCMICGTVELEKVSSVSLNEEEAIDLDKYPTVTLVRCSGESVWELAKTYHSSVERIASSNDIESELEGRMILVPKCI